MFHPTAPAFLPGAKRSISVGPVHTHVQVKTLPMATPAFGWEGGACRCLGS